METTRQLKISKLVQKDLGEILRLLAPEQFKNAMVTVTKVYITRDLSVAKVYVSLFTRNSKSEVLELIRNNTREIRHQLGNRVRNQLRKVPELQFFEDDSLDYIENIEKLLD